MGERKIKTRVAQLFVTYSLQWQRKTMCGREKDKDKSKLNYWSLTDCSGRERQCVGKRKIKTRVAQLFVTYSLQWQRKTMCGREKDKDKSKLNYWSLTDCSGRERQCVGERKIKTRGAQLFVTYCLQWQIKTMCGREKDKDRVAQLFVIYKLQW